MLLVKNEERFMLPLFGSLVDAWTGDPDANRERTAL